MKLAFVVKVSEKSENLDDFKKEVKYLAELGYDGVELAVRDPKKVDMMDWELQINRYRLWLEEAGFPVRKMIIQVTVRDGGTYIAENRGVDRRIYLIPVLRQDDEQVQDYFDDKAVGLQLALEDDNCAKCDSKESWDGIRCERFCEVYYHCEEMGE